MPSGRDVQYINLTCLLRHTTVKNVNTKHAKAHNYYPPLQPITKLVSVLNHSFKNNAIAYRDLWHFFMCRTNEEVVPERSEIVAGVGQNLHIAECFLFPAFSSSYSL